MITYETRTELATLKVEKKAPPPHHKFVASRHSCGIGSLNAVLNFINSQTPEINYKIASPTSVNNVLGKCETKETAANLVALFLYSKIAKSRTANDVRCLFCWFFTNSNRTLKSAHVYRSARV